MNRFKQNPRVASRGLNFVFGVKEYNRFTEDAEYFLILDDEDVSRYLQVRGFAEM